MVVSAGIPNLRQRAPRRMLATICSRLFPGEEIARIARLAGGIDAATHRIDLVSATARDKTRRTGTRQLVLRRYGPAMLAVRPLAVVTLYQTLQALFVAGVPAPQPLFLDESGADLGVPSLIVSYVGGRSVLALHKQPQIVAALASLLARLHAVSATHASVVHLPSAEQHFGLLVDSARSKIRGLSQESEFSRALDRLRLQPFRTALIHGDFWPGNVVIDKDQPAAILDFDQAALGDVAYDLAYCRLDLSLLFGSDGRAGAPAEFLAAYQKRTGRVISKQELALWEILAATRALPDGGEWLPGYHGLGRRDLNRELVRARLQAFVQRALRCVAS